MIFKITESYSSPPAAELGRYVTGQNEFRGLKMQKTNQCRTYNGPSEFIKIIDQAIHEGADSVTIEYNQGLEIGYRFGTLTVADVFHDRNFEKELIGYLIEAANLKDKPKGIIKVTLNEAKYKIVVEEYDHFGESAFRLSIINANKINT